MEGKKNWMQPLTLLLCVALLFTVMKQGRELKELRSDLTGMHSDLRNEINSASGALRSDLQEKERLVEAYGITVSGVDDQLQNLQAGITLTLKRYGPDTSATLLVALGKSKQEIPLSQMPGGKYIASLSLPLAEGTEPLELTLLLDSGGVVTREAVGSYGTVAMLLPVQLGGWGGGGNRYQNGAAELGDWNVFLVDGSQNPVLVNKAEFLVYCNDSLVDSRTGIAGASGEYRLKEGAPIPCQMGDRLRLDFRCTDESGLRYTFPGVFAWTVSLNMEQEMTGGSSGGAPRLDWGES